MSKPREPLRLNDTCLCGADFTITCPDGRLGTDQHDMWLEAHEVCRALTPSPIERIKDAVAKWCEARRKRNVVPTPPRVVRRY